MTGESMATTASTLSHRTLL
jgi:uncharacterized protein YqfA (UPF0365 family)